MILFASFKSSIQQDGHLLIMVPFTKYETISRVCFKATLRVGVSSSSQSDPIRRYSPAPCSHPNMVTSGLVNCVEINGKCGAREGLERVEKAH